MLFLYWTLALMGVVSEPSKLAPIKFGPEFTFLADPSLTYADMADRMEAHLTKEQPEAGRFKITQLQENYRVRMTSPNNWWLSTYWDNGVVEVQTKPMTVEQFKFYKNDLQDAIFVSAANSGHFPALWQGGGHINIDATNFKKNPMLFRNFIVDMLNHNELFMGIFEYSAFYPQKPHEFAITSHPKLALELIDAEIRTNSLTFKTVVHAFDENLKGNSFKFNKIAEENRIEIRAVRPQASMDVWIRQISLLEARIRYLATIKGPIPYEPRVPWDYDDSESQEIRSKPPIDPQEALKSFYVYVAESGQKWQDHTDYLWPMWISGGEVKKFEESEWFLKQERSKGCVQSLAVGF